MGVKNTVQAITLASFDTASLSTSFQVVNSAGLTKPCFLLRIVNNSDKDVTISYDGTNAHDFVPDGGTLELPVQTNSQPNTYTALFPIGFKVYVKGASSGSGLVYLAGYYQPQGA